MDSTQIGPTDCDQGRVVRSEEALKSWDSLMAGIGNVTDTKLLLGQPLDFFREALSCYQNGAFMATALMCRSATELAVYYLAFRSKEKFAGRIVRVGHLSDEQLDEVDQMSWGDILQLAKDMGYLPSDLQARIDRIRDTANFAAHFGPKFDKQLTKIIKSEPNLPLKNWVSKNDALDVLRETVSVLQEFTRLA